MKDLIEWMKNKGGSLNLSIALFIVLIAVILDRPIPCSQLLGVAVGSTEWIAGEEGPPPTVPLILEFEGKRIIVNPDASVKVEDIPRDIVYTENVLYFHEPQKWLNK